MTHPARLRAPEVVHPGVFEPRESWALSGAMAGVLGAATLVWIGIVVVLVRALWL